MRETFELYADMASWMDVIYASARQPQRQA